MPNPQHIAFTTNDAVAAAQAMRARKAAVLPIPDNYYDDLDARLAPAPELREHSILHDRDEHGEYLHFYTEIAGSRVFFEVVQRIGCYRGYGGDNTAVRMASQRRRRLHALREAPGPQHQHDYSLAHLTALSLSPPELVNAAASSGYRYVGLRLDRVTPEEPHYPLATDSALMRSTKARLAATGVEVLDIELARMGPRDEPRDFLRILEAGAELGARHVITQLPDPDPVRKVDHFTELCDLARPLGLTLDLEFPSWTETADLAEAVRVLRAADRPPAVGLDPAPRPFDLHSPADPHFWTTQRSVRVTQLCHATGPTWGVTPTTTSTSRWRWPPTTAPPPRITGGEIAVPVPTAPRQPTIGHSPAVTSGNASSPRHWQPRSLPPTSRCSGTPAISGESSSPTPSAPACPRTSQPKSALLHCGHNDGLRRDLPRRRDRTPSGIHRPPSSRAAQRGIPRPHRPGMGRVPRPLRATKSGPRNMCPDPEPLVRTKMPVSDARSSGLTQLRGHGCSKEIRLARSAGTSANSRAGIGPTSRM